MDVVLQNHVIRVLQINDVHLDTVGPRSRRDDYFQSLLTKLEECADICRARQVDVVAFTGDIFHKKERVPYRAVSSLVQFLRGLSQHCLILGIPGNHDILSRPVLDNQAVNTLYAAGVMVLPGESLVFTKEKSPDRSSICFKGNPFYYELDKDRRGYAMPKHPTADFNVLIVHGTLLPTGQSFFGEWSNPDHLVEFEGDLILCGHYHDELGTFVGFGKNGQRFEVVNYGSIARGSVSGFNVVRTPKVALISFDASERRKGNFGIMIEPLALKSAKPAADIFDLQALEQTKQASSRMRDVVASIEAAAAEGILGSNPLEMLSRATKGVDKKVADKANEILKKAMGQ